MKLTPKQKKFADNYIETGNATESASKVYNVKNNESARSIGSQNLTKLNVQQYLIEKAERAKEVIFELMENSKNDAVRLNAGKDIMDRAGFKPVDKQEHEVKFPKPIDDIQENNSIQENKADEEPSESTPGWNGS